MRATGRTSSVWVWGAVAALTVGMVGVAAPANAAPPASSRAPVATASATEPVDDTVTVTYSVNRGAKQLRQPVSCTLDVVPTACGDVTASSKKLTSYSRDLTELAGGLHVFVVTFTLTDGGTATASVEFTIDTPTLEETCTTVLGGTMTYNLGPIAWRCFADPYLGGSVADVILKFIGFCESGRGGLTTSRTPSGTIAAAVDCYS